VLILARGGGSLEDLWAFNDQRVARAIHACSLPVVCGVGHETDFTIADLVADARAPTPSGAAELAVPDRRACLETLERTATRLHAGWRRELRLARLRLDGAERRLRLAHPGVRLGQQTQRLDDLGQRLETVMRAALVRRGARVDESRGRLRRHSLRPLLREYGSRQETLRERLGRAVGVLMARCTGRLNGTQRALHAVSPLATLERGFAIVTRADGTLLADAAAVRVGETIEARLVHGVLSARVTGKREEP